MIKIMPKKCPSCSQDMYVRLLKCSSCQTEIQGEYPLGRYDRLSDEQLDFLDTFIRCRGSLKEVGAIMGISYPTARNRLDSLIDALGYSDPALEKKQRLDILTQLKEGSITTEEALNLLQGGK